LLGSPAVSLTFLWAINAAHADPFGAVVVQHFEGVAVEDSDHLPLEISENEGRNQYAQ